MLARLVLPSILALTLFSGCVSTPTAEKTPALEACNAQVERWAAGSQGIQGQPQGDGGVIFLKPGVDFFDLFVIVSEAHAPKVRNEVKQGQAAKTIGTLKEGVCSHPQNGYPYKTFQFRLTPVKQKV